MDLVSSCDQLMFLFPDDFGQRALVGKVCMDRNGLHEHYKEETQESLDETSRCGNTFYIININITHFSRAFEADHIIYIFCVIFKQKITTGCGMCSLYHC